MVDTLDSMIVRPLHEADLESLIELAYQAGRGMTNLPTVPPVLAERLRHSDKSFEESFSDPEKGYYFFGLEDTQTHKIVGCSAIAARANSEKPFYSFKISRQVLHSEQLNYSKEHLVLYRVNDYQHTSEVCALLVLPEYRHSHHGTLISRSRFLFMAEYPQRFTHKIIAALRGDLDENGEAPFWNSFASHFIPLAFPHADKLTGIGQSAFIHDLLPDIPIFATFLDPKGQESIGKVREETKPAYNVLTKEGFEYNDYVDIFDAGPILESNFQNITSIRKNTRAIIKEIRPVESTAMQLIATTTLDFKACKGFVEILDESNVALPAHCAELLECKVGDSIRFIPIKL